MAAPTASTRLDPTGIMLRDGYRTLVTFTADRDLSVWEIGVTPPGLDGGDPIDTTTMHNDRWRSMSSRALITMTEFSMECAYDPVIYSQALNLINVETTITVRFPDGSTLAFYGFLKTIETNELREGEFPTCTLTVVPTNADPVTGAEENPVLVEVAGT